MIILAISRVRKKQFNLTKSFLNQLVDPTSTEQ